MGIQLQVSDLKKFKSDTCNRTPTWSHADYVTNKRVENQSRSRILLLIWLSSQLYIRKLIITDRMAISSAHETIESFYQTILFEMRIFLTKKTCNHLRCSLLSAISTKKKVLKLTQMDDVTKWTILSVSQQLSCWSCATVHPTNGHVQATKITNRSLHCSGEKPDPSVCKILDQYL